MIIRRPTLGGARLIAVALLGSVSAIATSAHAFESSEHCGLSNFALTIAIERALAETLDPAKNAELTEYRKTFAPDVMQCFPKHWFRPGTVDFSYGKIVALVDAQNTLDDVFLRYGGVPRGAESPSDLSETYFGKKAWLLGRFSLAGHNNISHFQGLLMSSFARWHESAVVAARRDGNLFQALATQAVADHFLQDFFAPGHVVTARDNLPDVVALSWHDRYNKSGLPIVVQNWSELAGLAQFAKNLAQQPGSTLDAAFASIAASRQEVDPARSRGAVADALQVLEASSEKTCAEGDDRYRAWPELLQALAERKGAAPLRNILITCVYGDGLLASTRPEIAQRVAAQKLLMSLIEAHYILEVIKEYQGTFDDEPFPEYLWCPQMTTDSFEFIGSDDRADVGPSPAAKTGERGVTCQEQVQIAEQLLRPSRSVDFQSCFDSEHCTPTYTAPVAITRYAAYVLNADDRKRFQAFDPVFALSLGFKSGSSNASNGSWAVETLPLGFVGARDYMRDRNFKNLGVPNIGVAIGFEAPIAASGSLDHAYSGRLIWALPRLDIQISAYGKKVYLENSFDRSDGWGYGVRFETGFSLLTAFLAFGREPVLEGAVRDRDEVFTAGVTLSFSARRAFDTARALGD